MGGVSRTIAWASLLLVLAACGGNPSPSSAPSSAQSSAPSSVPWVPASAPSSACPSTPLEGVRFQPHHPERLIVLKPCRIFQGVVVFVHKHRDGDFHVDIRPDPGYERFLSSKAERPHTLVTEIIPSHPLPIPHVGEHVRVTGTWVLDTIHGWNEIHPVWTIRKL